MTSFGDGGSRDANVTLSANVSPYQSGVAQADQSTRGLSASIDALTAKMSQLNRSAQGKLLSFAKGDIAAMGVATGLAATFEKQLSTLKATAVVTGQNFDSMKRHIEGVFTSLPVSRTEVVQMTEALSNLGVKGGTNLGQLAATYEKLGAATGEFSISLAQSMTQLNRLMTNAGPQGAALFANTLLVLSKNAGVSAQSVADFSNSIAPMGRVLGLTEQQTLGLSTSFVKAGSDGFVAANLFNSMADEINQAEKRGSPALLKYANLLGVTAEQFKRLPPAEMITDLVDAIAKGGPAAQQFAQAMGLGPRQMASLTALAQSGDLAKNMQTAMGVTGTKQLESASKAAFGGLTDQLVNVRNELTQAGTAIGTTFLTPVTLALKGVNGLANAMGGLVSMFSGVAGGAMALAAPLAGVGALALHVAGIVGAYALARMVGRSTGMAGFSAGRAVARGVPLERMTGEQRQAFAAYTAGTMRPYQARAMEAGQRAELFAQRAFPAGGVPTLAGLTPGQVLRGAAIAPGRAISWLLRDNTRFVQDAMRDSFARQGMQWGAGGGPRAVWANLQEQARRGSIFGTYRETARTGVGYGAALLGAGTRMGAEILGAPLARIAGGIHPGLAGQEAFQTRKLDLWADRFDKTAQSAAAMGKSMTQMPPVMNTWRDSVIASGAAVKAWGGQVAKAGMVGGLRAGAAVGGAVVGGAGRLLGGAFSTLFSPYGMAAIMATSYFSSRNREQQQKLTDIQESDYWARPVKMYNDQLGIATKNLTEFGTQLSDQTDVTKVLGDVTEKTSMKQVAAWGNIAQAATAGTKVTDVNIQNIKDLGGTTKDLAEYFQSLGITDPRVLRLVQAQAAGAGFGQQQIAAASQAAVASQKTGAVPSVGLARLTGQAALPTGIGYSNWVSNLPNMLQYHAFGGPNISPMRAFSITTGVLHKLGLFKTHENEAAVEMRGTLESAINQQYDGFTQLYNSNYATQQKYISMVTDIGALIKTGPKGVEEAAKMAKDVWGGVEDRWKDAFNLVGDLQKKGIALNEAVVMGIRSVPEGKFQQQNLTRIGGQQEPTFWPKALTELKSGMTDAVTKTLMGQGIIGQYIAQSPLIKAATIGPRSDQPSVQFKAIQVGVDQMMKLTAPTDRFGAGINDVTSKLLSMGGAIDRAMASGMSEESPAFRLLQAQKAVVAGLQAQNLPTLAPAQQLHVAAIQLDQARAAAMRPHAPTTVIEDYNAQQANYNQLEEGERQHLISMIQMAHQYTVQRERMQEDYAYQVQQSNESFHIEMEHSEIQFQQQMTRSTGDFWRSIARQRQDFQIQMQRQTEDQSRSAFNPYERVQSQFTLSAGDVDENIRDATGFMRTQMREIRELQDMGISMQTIRYLRLADPSNFQQTENFYETVKAFPKLIGRTNQDVRQEMGAARQLIQSPYNQDYTRARADLNRNIDRGIADMRRNNQRAVHDFHQGERWAIEAHEREMRQLAHAFQNSMDRMQQDTAFSLRQYRGSYQHLMGIFRGEISASGLLLTKAGNQLNHTIAAMNRHINKEAQTAEDAATRVENARERLQNEPRQPHPPGAYAPFTGPYSDGSGASVSNRGGNTTVTPGETPSRVTVLLPSGVITLGHQAGGISTYEHTARISEGNRAEAIIPLDSARGQLFLAQMYTTVSRQLVQQLNTAGRGRNAIGGGSTTVNNNNYDHSTDISGKITVMASSPEAMLRALQQRQRLAQLTRPPGAGRS